MILPKSCDDAWYSLGSNSCLDGNGTIAVPFSHHNDHLGFAHTYFTKGKKSFYSQCRYSRIWKHTLVMYTYPFIMLSMYIYSIYDTQSIFACYYLETYLTFKIRNAICQKFIFRKSRWDKTGVPVMYMFAWLEAKRNSRSLTIKLG